MATVTLVESSKLCREELVAGIIATIINTDQMFELLPFNGIGGNALAYSRENARGDVQYVGVGDSITATSAATFTKVTSSLTTLISQAEVNQLIQETRSDDGNDQTAVQLASKAASMGDQYRDSLINGTGAGDEFTGLISLCASSQKVATGANGRTFDFDVLDELFDLVLDKRGKVDYCLLPFRTRRKFLAKLRALGGASIGDTVTLPSGNTVPAYRGVPLFVNSFIPVDQVKGASTGCTTILAGTFDDGSEKYGISGLTARNAAGMRVSRVGTHQTKDEEIYRTKWYCGLALYNEKGLAIADGIQD
jgi:HK97 family phage major capsid protein